MADTFRVRVFVVVALTIREPGGIIAAPVSFLFAYSSAGLNRPIGNSKFNFTALMVQDRPRTVRFSCCRYSFAGRACIVHCRTGLRQPSSAGRAIPIHSPFRIRPLRLLPVAARPALSLPFVCNSGVISETLKALLIALSGLLNQ